MTRKEQIKKLWQICFNDTKEFVDFYFARIYKEENALTIEQSDKVVSAMQLIPYKMLWYGMELSVIYVSGACTSPKERGKGLMKDLLQKSFIEMERRAIDISTLIPAEPWLFDYYRSQGYTEAFDYSLYTYKKEIADKLTDDDIVFVPVDTENASAWFPYFNERQHQRKVTILHDREDFENIIIDTFIEKGIVLLALSLKKGPVGLAFAVPNKEYVYVKEIMYDNEMIRKALLYECATKYRMDTIVCKIPPTRFHSKKLGMVKIFQKEKMIRHWLSTQPEIHTTMETLPEVDGESFVHTIFNYEQKEGIMNLMMD